MKQYEMTKEQRNKAKGLLPSEMAAHGGGPGKGNRAMLNGILYWLNTGIPWRDLPERYGRWRLQGAWERVFEKLIAQVINAGQHHNQGPPAWQRRKKGGGEALGRSRGGLSTKVHAVVDGLENSLRVLLTPGNRNDICYAQQLLGPFDL